MYVTGLQGDGLDMLIRLFVLGLSISRQIVCAAAGDELVRSLEALGLLGMCPAAPHLVVPYVQLFPLDAGLTSGAQRPSPALLLTCVQRNDWLSCTHAVHLVL